MTPAILRCESRRPAAQPLSLWRYSLALMIVVAALLDAVWWVPAHESQKQPQPNVQTTVPRCK